MNIETLLFLSDFSTDEALVYASDYWQHRLISTLKSKRVTYALNSETCQCINEVFIMAGKKVKSEGTYAKANSNDIQWINVSLSDDDIAELEGWIASEPNFLTELCRLVDSGYAIGCKPAANGDGLMATIIGKNADNGSQSYGLSAYSDTAFNAYACLLFKFVSKLDRTFPNAVSQGRNKYR